MSGVTSALDREAGLMKALCDEHATVLRHYVLRLTRDASRAQDVAQETPLRAWPHPEVIDDAEPSTWAWPFTVARDMIIDERRSARCGNVVGWLDPDTVSEQGCSEEGNVALDRLLIADSISQSSAKHRAVIDTSCDREWTTAQIAADLGIAEAAVKPRLQHAVRALRLTPRQIGVTR